MKIGFCGKFSFKDKKRQDSFNFKTSTLSYLSKLSSREREYKLDLILEHNLNC